MKKLLALLAAVAVMAGCSTEYYSYSGGRAVIGTGGASKGINGIDLWITGSPPRKYQIIGYISDSRPGGPIPMAARDNQIAAEARAKGGDGVIMSSDNSQYVGSAAFVNSSAYWNNVSTTAVSVPLMRQNGTYFVIKYL